MKRFAVIGLGRFGFHVARALFEEGHEVIAMDCDKASVQHIEPYCSEAIVLDGTDKERLKALGLEMMDAVILSIGTHISSSILICLYLQEIGVKRIITKALDEDHAKILKKVGATDVVHPEKDMAIRTARELTTPNILDFVPLGKDYTIAQIEAPGSFVGKSLSELNIRARYDVFIIAVRKQKQADAIHIPSADYKVRAQDILMMLGRNADIQKIKNLK